MINNVNIDHGKGFDWGKASKDYAKYRDIYPAEFYDMIISCGLCVKEQKVLDLGTGTGVPRNMHRFGAKFSEHEIDAFEREHMDYLNGVKEEFIIPHTVTFNQFKKEKNGMRFLSKKRTN